MSRSVNTWGTVLWHGLLIAGLTFVVYWQVRDFPFVGYDDPVYTFEDPLVSRGLTWRGAWEAFAGFRFANWHPLTWWSLMLDTTLFGLHPGAFHLMNAGIHLANSLLLYAWLRQTFGCPGRSLFAALLFAIHPLHVESVAWVSSRKDLLSTFFLLLTLIAYTSVARGPWSLWRYGGMVVTFALAVMAKSMAITLPVLLLVLDVWPLRRWPCVPETQATGDGAGTETLRSSLLRLVGEKVPLFVLSAVVAWLTFRAQASYGMVGTATRYSLGLRLQNVVISYATYLVKSVWPSHLAVFYPLDPQLLTVTATLWAMGLLGGLLAAAVLMRRSRPELALGLAWFLISLLPVIGFVPVGHQARADRYTYVPLIGVFVALAWGLVPPKSSVGWLAPRAAFAAAAFVIALTAVAHVQTSYWQSSTALYQHAVQVVPRNFRCHANLASAHLAAGRLGDAERHAKEALTLVPSNRAARLVLAECQYRRGEFAEALRIFADTIPRLGGMERPARLARALRLMAVSADRIGRQSDADRAFEASIRAYPRSAETYRDWSRSARARGRIGDAIQRLEQGLRELPRDVGLRRDLAELLASTDDPALRNSQRALELTLEADRLAANSGDLVREPVLPGD